MKRIALFLLTNLAIVVVLGLVSSVLLPLLGVDRYNLSGLLVFAAIFGFGGAFISLAISKWMAVRATGAQVIESPANHTERWLLNTVRGQAQKAGIGMPDVAVYDSPEINAFATGMNRNKALVAVSTGLLRNMDQDEAEAVLAHEVSHVANGDMVTLALIQGVVNTFVIFLARVVAGIVNNALRGNNQSGSNFSGGFAYMMIVMVLEVIFGVLASVIVMWFSRQREFRADAGSAALVGRHKMIKALERLKSNHDSQLDGSMMAFGIARKHTNLGSLFRSHPPLEDRIAALQR